jgi:hypothetical protein
MMQRKIQSWFEFPGRLSDVFLVGQLALCGSTHTKVQSKKARDELRIPQPHINR